MWILPKQLHISVYALDTRALVLDSEAFSQLCEKSLTWRGKDSLSRTWLQRWKRESWMQHLCSRTLKPSHTESFVDSWTSFPEDSRVSHSQLLESVKLLKTPGTSSPTSQTELESANLELFSSKTYKESSAARQPTESQFSNMSSESWKDWVIEQRQEYSQRKKSAHLIRESESTSLGWPTARTSDAEGGRIETEMTDQGFKSKRHKSNQTFGAKLRDAVETHEEQKNWATPSTMDHINVVRKPEERSEKANKGGCKNLREEVMQPQNWPTPTAVNRVRDEETMEKCLKFRQSNGQTSVPLYLEEKVIREPQNWPTASARDWKDTAGMSTERDGKALGRVDQLPRAVYHHDGLQDQANPNTNGKSQGSWGTPRSSTAMSATITENLVNRNVGNLEEQQGRQSIGGKLNPNWVEHLMGLPAGWTDLGSWETE